MKVLRLTPHYYFESDQWPGRFDALGGMQVQITILSQWLAEHAVEQDVLTTGFPGIPRKITSHKNLAVHSIRFLTLPFKSKYTGTLLLDQSWSAGVMLWLTKHRKKSYDCVHVHASGVIWPLLIGAAVSSLLRIPLVLSIHCSRHFTYEPMNTYDRLIHPLVKWCEKKVIYKSRKTILLTQETTEKYRDLLPECNDTFVTISDCVAPYHLVHKKGECCFDVFNKYSIPQNKKIILYVGRIAHEKGWRTFVEVAKRLRDREDVFFLVCGDGPQKEEMKTRMEAYELRGNYKITGFVSHHTIPCIMANAHILMIPSIHEELGGTSLEGVIAGVPIVASNIGGLKALYQNKCTALLCEPHDTNAFLNATICLLEHEAIRKRLINNAKETVIQQFLPNTVLPFYKTIYESLL